MGFFGPRLVIWWCAISRFSRFFVGFVFWGVFFLSFREQKVTSVAAVVVGQDCNGWWIWKKKKVVLVFTV